MIFFWKSLISDMPNWTKIDFQGTKIESWAPKIGSQSTMVQSWTLIFFVFSFFPDSWGKNEKTKKVEIFFVFSFFPQEKTKKRKKWAQFFRFFVFSSGKNEKTNFRKKVNPLFSFFPKKVNSLFSEKNCLIGPICNSSVKIYWKTTFKDPMFIRGSPYNTTHITTVWAHTTTVWADETTVWVNPSVKTYWKTPFKGPMFIRGSPYKTIHITPVWLHTTTVYPNGKHLSRPYFYQGFPL